MKTASLALAAALAITVVCTQPAAAQTQDQTGAATADKAAPDDTGNATTGSGRSDESGDWRRDDRENSADGGNSRRQWTDRAPMAMPMRPMWPRRRMMMQGQAAHFHFARGNARIDVTCSAQEDTEACVRGAGELIDKIAELHGASRDNTAGRAGRGDDRSNAATPNDDDQDAAGERM